MLPLRVVSRKLTTAIQLDDCRSFLTGLNYDLIQRVGLKL